MATYTVTRAYRGVNTGDTILISDKYDVGACGLGKLTVGGEYLIYGREVNSEKFTSSCVGNSRVPILILPRDSATVNRMRSHPNYGSLDDTVHTTFHADTLFLSGHLLKSHKKGKQKFYDKDGKLSAEGIYENGLPEGTWRYYDAGKLKESGNYLDGKKDSMWVHHYETWVDITEFRNGEFTFRQTSYSNGNIYKKEGPVGDGKKWISSVYHENGKPRYIAYSDPPKRNNEGKLERPVWNGPLKTFNKAGVMLDEGVLEKGLHAGHWKYYYEDGKLRMEGEFTEGKKTGIWKIYYPNKRIKASGTYDKGDKLLDWKYFDELGAQVSPNPALIKEDEDWFTYTGVKN